MIFTASVKPLIDALTPLARIAPTRNTIPILSHVRIVAEADGLQLTVSDLDREAQITLAANVERPGAVCVPAQRALDALSGVGREANVRFAVDDRRARFSAGRAKFVLPTLPAEDFASMSDAPFPHSMTIDAAAFAAWLACVSHAVSTEETRYYLNGVFFDAASRGLTLVATDGHRLAKIETGVEMPKGAPSMLAPIAAVKEFQRLAAAAKAGETLLLWLSNSRARLCLGDLTLTTKLIDATFPDYTRVIPADTPKRFELDAARLAEALKCVRVANAMRGASVKFALGETLQISCRDSEGAEAQDEIDCVSDAALAIGFNGQYASEAIAALTAGAAKDARIVIRASDPGAPAILTNPADAATLIVLMPLRI